MANRPNPDPIAEASGSVPLQLLPMPPKVTLTFVPTGGVKLRVGMVPKAACSLKARLTATLTLLLVVWIGPSGMVVILPAGGIVLITKNTPDGAPLKTLPARSWAVARTEAAPNGEPAGTLRLLCRSEERRVGEE